MMSGGNCRNVSEHVFLFSSSVTFHKGRQGLRWFLFCSTDSSDVSPNQDGMEQTHMQLVFVIVPPTRLEKKSCMQLSDERSRCFSMCKTNHAAKYSRFKNILLSLLMEGVGCAFEDLVDPSVYCFCIMFWELRLCTPCDSRSLAEYSGESGFTAHIQVIKPGHSNDD